MIASSSKSVTHRLLRLGCTAALAVVALTAPVGAAGESTGAPTTKPAAALPPTIPAPPAGWKSPGMPTAGALPPAGQATSTDALQVVYESVVAPAYPENKPNYRIPSIVQTKNGDLVAFMERRQWGYGDISDNEMVLRRSKDEGKTWGPDEPLVVEGNYANSDPCPLLDSKGRVWFYFMFDRKEIAYKHTTDNEGAMGFSKATLIHSQFVPQEWNEYAGGTNFKPRSYADKADMGKNWKEGWAQRYGVGPGVAGVEIQEGPHKGRLVIPARAHVKTKEFPKGVTYTYAFYSDDHGKTYKMGGLGIPYGNENQIVELAGGKLLCSSRDSDDKHKPDKYVRRFANSDDGGETWKDIREVPELIHIACHNAIKRYKHGDQDLLMFTGPCPPDRTREEKHPYGRRDMGMQISKDMGKTWSKPVIFYKPTSSYSEIMTFADGTIGVIYERGPADTDRYWDELSFVRLKPDFSKFEF